MRLLLILLVGMVFSSSAFARDTIGDFSIKEALGLEQAKSELGDQIKFYFGKQSHAKVIRTYLQIEFGLVATYEYA